MYSAILVTFLIFVVHTCNSARILGIVPTPSYSHQIVFQPLWKELSLRGHQVIVITANPVKDPSLTKLTEISVHDESYRIWNAALAGKFEKGPFTNYEFIKVAFEALVASVKAELENPQVQALINNKNEHFDLLIVEFITPVFYAFAERFKCPFIGMISLDPFNYYYSQFGNPANVVVNPDMILEVGETLNFFERVTSVLANLMITFMYEYIIDSGQSLVEQHFGKEYQPVRHMIQNMSLMFVNTDPILYRARPLTPNIIQIGGGSHLKPPKPLPQDLKTYLDAAKEGFIYFSLGSNIKSKDLSPETTNVLLQTFAELPYKVLWKFELDELQSKPDNVYTSKWFPQQDVLRHPNIKLFITQGGLQSIEESLHSNVPMVGMAFFADQPANIKRVVIKGMGLSVDHTKLTKEEFKSTILEVIQNPKYKEKVTELANLVVDQPMTGLERAVWWTEYVIRHKGAKHLRSPALDLPTYQYYLLDVIGFFSLVVIIVVFVIIKIVMLFLRLLKFCFGSKEKPQQKQKRH